MNLKNITLFAAALWVNTGYADGCESQIIQALAKQIAYQPVEIETHDCKVMPAQPQHTLVAIAQFKADPALDGDDNVVGDYDLDLIIMETESLKVIKRLTKAKAIAVDAVTLTGLNIDTAKYNVNRSQRAFGVRVQLANNSRISPYSQTLLHLYVEVDGGIKQILQGFEVGSYSGEWDDNCQGEFTSSNSILAMQKPEASGFADMLVRTETEITRAELRGQECIDKSISKSSQRSLLKYSAGSYKSVTDPKQL